MHDRRGCIHMPPPLPRGVRPTTAPHHRQIERWLHHGRSRQVSRQADMGKSMPIDRVNSASLLQGGAKPLVTERDDHLPEKNSWQKNEFNGHEPVELNHFSQKKRYYPVNFQSQRLLQHTGISTLISASTAMGKFESSNNLNMTRKALKKTFRQSPNTRRSSATTTPPPKKKKPTGNTC